MQPTNHAHRFCRGRPDQHKVATEDFDPSLHVAPSLAFFVQGGRSLRKQVNRRLDSAMPQYVNATEERRSKRPEHSRWDG